MKLSIRLSAREDLAGAFVFYEQQEEGLGTYFFDTIFSEIDSLTSYAGIHQRVFGYHRFLSNDFPTPSVERCSCWNRAWTNLLPLAVSLVRELYFGPGGVMWNETRSTDNGKKQIQEQKKADQSPNPTRDWEETDQNGGKKSERWVSHRPERSIG